MQRRSSIVILATRKLKTRLTAHGHHLHDLLASNFQERRSGANQDAVLVVGKSTRRRLVLPVLGSLCLVLLDGTDHP